MASKRTRFTNIASDLRAALAQVHLEPTPFRSPITGRTVYVNLSEDATAVLPTFTRGRLAAARADWVERVEESLRTMREHHARVGTRKGKSRHIRGITLRLLSDAEAMFAAPDAQAFADHLHALLTHWLTPGVRGNGNGVPGTLQRGIELLVLLWKHDLIALPAGHVWRAVPFNLHAFPEFIDRWYGPRVALLRELRGDQDSLIVGSITRFFLACGNVRESGDVGAEVFAALRPYTLPAMKRKRVRGNAARPEAGPAPAPAAGSAPRRDFTLLPNTQMYGVCDRFQLLQRHDYEHDPAAYAKVPQSYRDDLYPKQHDRSDPEFKWADAAGPRLAFWRSAVAGYVASRRGVAQIHAFILRGNQVLDYVIANPDVPADPLDFCRRDFRPQRSLVGYLEAVASSDTSAYYVRSVRGTQALFGWFLASRALDENGHVQAEYRNPIADIHLPSERARNGQTYRNAIPLRFIRMLREIIEEDDFAWPRSLQGDYFRWRDPKTGEWSRVWSPVRALFFLLRLILPLRGFQVRMLDSGEGDSEIYRPGAGEDGADWVPNTGRHAPARTSKRPPQGFVRRMFDHDAGAWVTGLYVNTNKTADRAAEWETAGYDIPWAPGDVLDIFVKMRDFRSCA